jgi:hypothetical protein
MKNVVTRKRKFKWLHTSEHCNSFPPLLLYTICKLLTSYEIYIEIDL